ncbi:Pyruvate kinase [Serendipita sp. 397]|nr:Pyruvate kinase [Serendipita sp. 397]
MTSTQIPASASRLQWLASLTTANDEFQEKKFLRKTAIIATIGPKTNSPDMLQKLREAGMNIGTVHSP